MFNIKAFNSLNLFLNSRKMFSTQTSAMCKIKLSPYVISKNIAKIKDNIILETNFLLIALLPCRKKS